MKEGISICVTAYQTQDYIEECLDSIYKQTYFKTNKNYEVLLGIDGCEKVLEKVEKIAYKYPNFKVFLMNKNVGTYVTSNTIMCNADYKWLMRFDSDDIMPENFVEEIMNNTADIDVIMYYMKKFGDIKLINNSYVRSCGSCLINKDTFVKYGGYRDWRFNADFDFLYRLENDIRIKVINHIFYYTRCRENSLTHSEETGLNSKERLKLNKFVRNESRNQKTIKCVTSDYKLVYNSFKNITTSEIKNKIIKTFTSLGFINNIENPQTIQEKIQWLKIYDSTPLKALCADKIKVHNYCEEKLGEDICVPIYKVYNSPDEIILENLPSQFVIKANHACRFNIVVKNKNEVSLTQIKNNCKDWLNTNYALIPNGYEMHYSQIEPKIFSEKYLNNNIIDYKICCFNGTPKILQICFDRNIDAGQVHCNYYDENLQPMYISDLYNPASYDSDIKFPKNFNLMKEYAKKLSEDFKFVRVDFYEVNNKIYLGELTFTPASGMLYYENDEDKHISLMLGNMLNLK